MPRHGPCRLPPPPGRDGGVEEESGGGAQLACGGLETRAAPRALLCDNGQTALRGDGRRAAVARRGGRGRRAEVVLLLR